MFRNYQTPSELKNFVKHVNKIYNLLHILEHNSILEFLSYCFSFISDKTVLKNKFKDQQFQKTFILNVTFCILNVMIFFSLNLIPNLRNKSHGNCLNYYMINQQVKIKLSEKLTTLIARKMKNLTSKLYQFNLLQANRPNEIERVISSR